MAQASSRSRKPAPRSEPSSSSLEGPGFEVHEWAAKSRSCLHVLFIEIEIYLLSRCLFPLQPVQKIAKKRKVRCRIKGGIPPSLVRWSFSVWDMLAVFFHPYLYVKKGWRFYNPPPFESFPGPVSQGGLKRHPSHLEKVLDIYLSRRLK